MFVFGTCNWYQLFFFVPRRGVVGESHGGLLLLSLTSPRGGPARRGGLSQKKKQSPPQQLALRGRVGVGVVRIPQTVRGGLGCVMFLRGKSFE